MALVQLFHAPRATHRWRTNQKVWIRYHHANHLEVWFKWRGKGRYVTGVEDKFGTRGAMLPIKTIDVGEQFAREVHGCTPSDPQCGCQGCAWRRCPEMAPTPPESAR